MFIVFWYFVNSFINWIEQRKIDLVTKLINEKHNRRLKWLIKYMFFLSFEMDKKLLLFWYIQYFNKDENDSLFYVMIYLNLNLIN